MCSCAPTDAHTRPCKPAVNALSLDPAVHHASVQALSEVCAVCNDAHIEYKEGRYHAVGAPTEAALVVLVEKLGVADPGLKSRIQQQRAASPEGHADGTCQAYCRRWQLQSTPLAAVLFSSHTAEWYPAMD